MRILIFYLTFSSCLQLSAQISFNTDHSLPDPSALLDIKSNSKGLLIPRMSSAQRKTIVTPAAGLLVFDLDKSTIYMYDGDNWQAMLFANSGNANPPIGRTAADGQPSDKFGQSVGITADYAIIGAPLDDIGTKADQGSAYIFARQAGQWKELIKLTASDGAAGDNFGSSVSISGDYAVLGAPKGSGAWFLQGAAYVFIRTGSGWVQHAKLNAADGIIGNAFGTSVNISGSDIIIGDPKAYVTFASQGAAYVFARNGTSWPQQAKLIYSGGEYNEGMGFSVAISGNYAVAGAPYRDVNGYPTDVGAAYVFVRSGINWTFQDFLYNADGYNDYNFGYSVGISGDYIIVGEPGGYSAPHAQAGAAYVYHRSNIYWQGTAVKLTASDAEEAASFGVSVSISGDYIIAGSFFKDAGLNSYQGAAYIYQRGGANWNLMRKLDDPIGQYSGQFGNAVAVSGFNFIVGAVGKNNYKGDVSFLNTE